MLFIPLPLVALFLLPLCTAQFPPPATYANISKSPINENITISYNSPEPGTCTTVFSTQKQYTGYITLPPFTLAPIQQNYSINTFFWFIEARDDPETAPLSIWLNGGPGSSSMIGLFEENGPCEVVQTSDGLYGTQARIWGWDRSSNVLYIDQPSQVGFSYDEVTKGSHNLLTDQYLYPPESVPDGQPAYTFLNGSFGSGDASKSTNTTAISAHAVWHFLQGFLSTFPQYNPGTRPNDTAINATGINLFAESYGGQYGPAFADFFEDQNAKRANGTIANDTTLEIQLTSLGIVNGLIDELVQGPSYATFPYNNTYHLELFDQTTSLNILYSFNEAGGCKDLVTRCRAAASASDPEDEGDVPSVNKICYNASEVCSDLMAAYEETNRSVYDIRQPLPGTIPSAEFQEYLNDAAVQRSIGVPVNYTQSSVSILRSFYDSGDNVRGTQLDSLVRLLNLGIRVALIYGDADYVCNWVGGEAASLALAALLPAYASTFPHAGYKDLIVNDSYIGGVVREWELLSFARIYDAGHMVPAYQPETAFTLFTRIITGVDLSTGESLDGSSVPSDSLSATTSSTPTSTSPCAPVLSATHTNKPPSTTPSPTCWIRALSDTCPTLSITLIAAGKGVVEAGVWYPASSDYSTPGTDVVAGFPGTPMPSAERSSMAIVSVVVTTIEVSQSGSGSVDGAGAGETGKASVVTVTVQPTGVYVATGAVAVGTAAAVRVEVGGEWVVGWAVVGFLGLMGALVL